MAEDVIQIIPYYAHPHVHVKINDNTFYSEDTSTPTSSDALPYATCVVTAADSGIDNTFVRLQTLNTKNKIFGKGNFKKYGQASLQADMLFNGYTDVWFMRVLPKDATYSNMIVVAKYREGNELDATGLPTGKKRLEIKFEVVSGDATTLPAQGGPRADDEVLELGVAQRSTTADQGWCSMPLFYVRSTGRGKYGNKYAVKLTRDIDAEKDYGVKCYDWSLISNVNGMTGVTNVFAGSLYQTAVDNASTLISDVLDAYATGACPVYIYPYENDFMDLYDVYQKIVEENGKYIMANGAKEADVAEWQTAANITIEEFDPIFGLVYNTKSDESIPYYKNYTSKGGYVAPTKTIASGGTLPTTTTEWTDVAVGNTLLMEADPAQSNLRWLYTVIDINGTNIVYDEGKQSFVDDDQFTGVDLTASTGIALVGGSDGSFESISVNGVTRAPSDAELKLLIAKEQVQAFRGNKDRKILSPARVNLDFIFDANYNMTVDGDIGQDNVVASLYNNSSVLTTADYKELAVLSKNGATIDVSDVNVKQAIYDLNNFRNRNGMTIEPDYMAGCLAMFDCGIINDKDVNRSSELKAVIDSVTEFKGRTCTVDLGYYEIFDPYTGRREAVTVGYFLAKNYIKHIIKYGMAQPFAMSYAQLTAIQRSDSTTLSNDMIRDTFAPDIDLIDWDTKEALYNARINYYITSDEGRLVQRACQNTRQTDASALLEENNMRVLNALKKGLDKACQSYLFNWNEPTARKGFTDSQMQIYRPWIGRYVEDLDIRFEANQYETSRMMMHCYVDVKFRNIIKRIILEININRNEG